MTQDPIAMYRERGYAVVPGLFDAREIAALAEAFDCIHALALAKGRSWRDRNTFFRLAVDDALGPIVRYVQWPAWIDDTLERVRRDPRIAEVLAPLVGGDLKQIINQMHWKPPGAAMAEFGFHQDSRSRRPPEAYRDLGASYIQTGIAVDPHRAENGAMTVVAGSHKLGALPFDSSRSSMNVSLDTGDLAEFGARPDDVEILDLNPGDFAFWNVYTLHGSGPNTSAIDRRFYLNGYVIAENCDRGEWAFRNGKPCPLSGEPVLVHYEDLHTNPGPMFVD